MFISQANTKDAGDELIYPANWDPGMPFSFVALRDLANAATTVIAEREKHSAAKYDMQYWPRVLNAAL
jgi:hypothetical protein